VAQGPDAATVDALPLVFTILIFGFALFVPAVISRFVNSDPPSGPEEGGEGGGGGGGPPRRPAPPDPPLGGLPLDFSRPARVRLRDARRLAERLPRPERRRAREPTRTPVRAGELR